jgi:solute:Na+ symporter, SSS family
MRLTALDWIVLTAYFAGLTAMGLALGRNQTSREEYQLGGRRIHWLLAGGSLIATLLSTLSFVALPGEMVRHGPAFFSSLLALPLTVAVISYIVIPTFKAMPYSSAYEYLDRRFGGGVRRLAAVVFVTRTIIWMGLIIYTCCLVVTTATGWSVTMTILLVGAATTVYATVGGFRTVVYSDNIQLLILLGGALAIPLVVFSSLHTGPTAWWAAMSQAGHPSVQLFSFDPTVRLTVLGAIIARFFWTICTHGSDQVAVQRYLSTPSLGAARRTLLTAAVAETVLLALLMLCGTALFALYQHRSGLDPQSFLNSVAASADQLLPRFIIEELTPGFSGLMLAALLAAAMSSLSSGVSSVSSVVVGDLFSSEAGHAGRRGLRLDHIASTLAGLAGTLIALAIAPAAARTSWNLVDLMERLNHIFVGPLAVLFFSGMLFRRAGLHAALAGFAGALACSLLICVPGRWLGMGGDVSFMWIIAVPFSFGSAIAWVVARVG